MFKFDASQKNGWCEPSHLIKTSVKLCFCFLLFWLQWLILMFLNKNFQNVLFGVTVEMEILDEGAEKWKCCDTTFEKVMQRPWKGFIINKLQAPPFWQDIHFSLHPWGFLPTCDCSGIAVRLGFLFSTG